MPNAIITEALQRFKQAEDAENDWRNTGLEADKFATGEQWPRNVKQAREVESRPCLTINRMMQFVRQVTNDARMNRPSVKIDPVDDSDKDVAEILEGLVRHIQVASNADVAYDTACQSQVTKGWGYFRVITDYCDDDTFDQNILIKRVKNAFSVYFDPYCQEPDYSDAKFAFVVSDIPMEEFKRDYPNADTSSLVFTTTGDTPPDWATNDTIRVCEYFSVEEKPGKLYQFSDGMSVGGDDAEAVKKQAEAAGVQVVKERDTKVRKVIWRKITAAEVLEEKEWPGKFIPIIPVLGEDVDVDGKRHLTGMVYSAMDSQRQYNYMSTAQTEAIALAPKSPFIMAAGQVEGYEAFWKNANNVAYAYLPYNAINVDGQSVPPPQRNQAEPPIQAMVIATQKASEDMKATTGIFDANLGAKSNETSGKAIMARQKEGDVSNFHYIDNLSRAIRHLGVILIDLIPKIYDAPRVLRIVKPDMTSKMVPVNQPVGPDNKPIQPGMEGVAKIYDLTTGKYSVTVEVGPSFSTKRQEAADAMTSVIQAAPEIMQICGDLLVKNLDFPGADEMAERLHKALPPQLQDQDDGGEKVPPKAQAQMAQMDQMVQQLTQAVHQLQDEKDMKAADLASKEKIAAQGNETQLVIAAMKQEMMGSMELLKAELGQIMASVTHSHALEQQAQGGMQQAALADQSAGHQQAAAQQQAELAPPAAA